MPSSIPTYHRKNLITYHMIILWWKKTVSSKGSCVTYKQLFLNAETISSIPHVVVFQNRVS